MSIQLGLRHETSWWGSHIAAINNPQFLFLSPVFLSVLLSAAFPVIRRSSPCTYNLNNSCSQVRSDAAGRAVTIAAEGQQPAYTLSPAEHGMELKTPDGRTVFRYMTRKPEVTNLTANSVCCLYPVLTPSGVRAVDLCRGPPPSPRYFPGLAHDEVRRTGGRLLGVGRNGPYRRSRDSQSRRAVGGR